MRLLQNYRQRIGFALVLTIIVFITADLFMGETIHSSGIVIDKVYIPERNCVTYNTTVNSKGHARSYPVHHHDPAEWNLIVLDKSEAIRVVSSAHNYYRTEIGATIPFSTRLGGLTKARYFSWSREY